MSTSPTAEHDGPDSDPLPSARRGRLRFVRHSAQLDFPTPDGASEVTAPIDATQELAATVARLESRNAQLEQELADLHNRPPDLSKLSDADLAVLASDAAASILRVARAESEAAAAASEEQLDAARHEAARHLDAARHDAEAILGSATERARQLEAAAESTDRSVRASADAYALETREKALSEADATVKSARNQAEAIMAKVKLEAEQFLESAIARRDALFADLELQRRLVQSTLEDASAVQAAFTEGYGHLRKTLDDALAHLIDPMQRARRQVASLDRELFKREEDEVDFGPTHRYSLRRPEGNPPSRPRRGKPRE
jgi:hypothetical protein